VVTNLLATSLVEQLELGKSVVAVNTATYLYALRKIKYSPARRRQRPADAASEVSQRPQQQRIAGDLPYNRLSLI
jgi:hypothetical protein